MLAGLPRLDGNPHQAALIDGVRLHDLRHSFASVAIAGGLTLPLILCAPRR